MGYREVSLQLSLAHFPYTHWYGSTSPESSRTFRKHAPVHPSSSLECHCYWEPSKRHCVHMDIVVCPRSHSGKLQWAFVAHICDIGSNCCRMYNHSRLLSFLLTS